MSEENPYAAPQTPTTTPAGPAPPMTIKKLLFSFEGRINRAKFWGGMVAIYAVVFVVAAILGALFPGDPETVESAAGLTESALAEDELNLSAPGFVILGITYIFFIWTALAIQVKRWHDRGKSGWMVLINFIPLVGPLWALVECGFLSGTPGPNQHGQDPLGREG